MLASVAASELICEAIGLAPNGRLGREAIPPYFLETGTLGGWRGEVSSGETGAVLLLVLVVRVCFAMVEVKVVSGRVGFGRIVGGSSAHHYMLYALVLAVCFVIPTELAFFGRDIAAERG